MPRVSANSPRNESAVIEIIRFCVTVAFSAVIIGGALYIILSKNYDDEYVKWAFGMVGIIIGYWLAPRKKDF